MNTERLAQLKIILEKNYGFAGSDEQVFEIGKTLLDYFEILYKGRKKHYEKRENNNDGRKDQRTSRVNNC